MYVVGGFLMKLGRRARLSVAVALAATLLLALMLQAVLRPPDRTFDAAPEGWTTSSSTDDLVGLLSVLHTTTLPMLLNTTDFARVAAYASEAYWETRYRSPLRDQAKAAFLEVASVLLVSPAVIDDLPDWDRQQVGSAEEVLARAAADGYAAGHPDPVQLTSTLDLGVDPSRYSWRVSGGFGNELERGWGMLTPFAEHNCEVPPPPVVDLAQLQEAAAETNKLVQQLSMRPDIGRIRGLVEAWRSPQQSNPARGWVLIASNVAVDAGLDRRQTDTMLRDLAVALHDAQIVAWEAKYRFALASPSDVLEDFRLLAAPYNPSYPSEYALAAAVATTVIDRHAPGVRVRLEIPGTLISVPTTRVYANTADARTEAELVGQILGLDYTFSVIAGRDLGRCIAEQVMR